MALSSDRHLTLVEGDFGSIGAVASDTIYEGSAIGDADGYGRPLTAGDLFLGHSLMQVDNSSGSAGDENIRFRRGKYVAVVPLAGAVTDVGCSVYMSDDATYTFDAVDNSYVGKVTRYVSSTEMEVEFETQAYDEFGPNPNRVTKSDDATLTEGENGYVVYVDTDAKTITLPATAAGYTYTIVNQAEDGDVEVTVSPNANDKIMGVGLTSEDNKDLVNTKATAERGDYITLVGDGSDGWVVVDQRGTWARES